MKNNLPPVFTRRINLHKFEKMMLKGVPYIFYDSSNLNQFKYQLVKETLNNYLHFGYNIDMSTIPDKDINEFIEYLVEIFEPLLKMYYNNFKKKGRLS